MSYTNYTKKLQEVDNLFIFHENSNINMIKKEFKNLISDIPEKSIDYKIFHTLFFSNLVSTSETRKHIFSFVEMVFEQHPNWYQDFEKKHEINNLGMNTILRINSYPGAFKFFKNIINKLNLDYIDNSSMSMSHYLFAINGQERVNLLEDFLDRGVSFSGVNGLHSSLESYLTDLQKKIYNSKINAIEKVDIDTLETLLTHPSTKYDFKKEIFFHPIFNHGAINSISFKLDLDNCLEDKSLTKNQTHKKNKI